MSKTNRENNEWLAMKRRSFLKLAAGADGLIIEVHNDPAHALSDGAQSLTYESFQETMASIRRVAQAVGREV